jgi:signal transduction histidine kinase
VSAPSQSALQAEAEARLRFEMLLADSCAQFVNLAPSDVDSKIENAQRVICESLRVDHSSVWQVSEENPDLLVKAHDLPSPLSPDISLCLFRVLQEALHNSPKHSGVRRFEVRLGGTSDEIHLTVNDSGAGFDREAAKESRGLGLISMEERLKLVKGTISINSRPKRGTTIHARVPLSSGGDSMRAAG